jgi:hypothetical protein
VRGALVFEVHQASPEVVPSVRAFFSAQRLDDMRALSRNPRVRVPVFIPGCPSLDYPLPAFDRIAGDAIDPAFVGT